MKTGWIKLYRQIENNWTWFDDKEFSKGQAWVDLILSANHEARSVRHGREIINVAEGGMITSIKHLSERWGWSMGKTKKFLSDLQKTNMINFKSDTKKTIIVIENYLEYQNNLEPEYNKQELIINNNKNKNNNIDTPADQEEIQDQDHQLEDITEIIQVLNNYAGASYKATTAKTQKLIKARMKEGHDITDFIQVIKNKCSDWLGSDMEKYLRPETLFGTKFESYLNQGKSSSKELQQDNSYIENNCWNQEQGKDYWNS